MRAANPVIRAGYAGSIRRLACWSELPHRALLVAAGEQEDIRPFFA